MSTGRRLVYGVSLWVLAPLLPTVMTMRPVLEEDAAPQLETVEKPDQHVTSTESGGASFLEHFINKDAEALGRGLLSVNLSPKEAAMKSLVRECILQKAELFGRIYKKFGGNWNDEDQTKLVEDVIVLQQFEEQRDNTWERFSKKQKAYHFVFKGKKLGSIDDQLKEVNKKISDVGFNYQAVQKRCKDVEDEDTYACMEEKHPEVRGEIRDYVDADDMLSHQKSRFSSCSAECKKAKQVKQTSKNSLKKSSVNLKKLKKECKAEVEKKTQDFMSYVSQQLRSTKENGRQCIEDPEKGYCPEGTAPRASREFDPAKGAKWFAMGYVVSYGGGWLALSVACAIIAIPGGPAAMLAGFGVGSMLAQMIPSTAIGTSLFAWNSIGPKECACFPRDCVMEDAGCMMKMGSSNSTNPFGQALPYLSMKCVEAENGTCSLQNCENSDYLEKHDSTNGIFFGRVGTLQLPGKVHEVYNCLASAPKAGKALAVQQILPNGKNNTAINRAEIFKSLGVEEKSDASKWIRPWPTRRLHFKGQNVELPGGCVLWAWNQWSIAWNRWSVMTFWYILSFRSLLFYMSAWESPWDHQLCCFSRMRYTQPAKLSRSFDQMPRWSPQSCQCATGPHQKLNTGYLQASEHVLWIPWLSDLEQTLGLPFFLDVFLFKKSCNA